MVALFAKCRTAVVESVPVPARPARIKHKMALTIAEWTIGQEPRVPSARVPEPEPGMAVWQIARE